MTFEPLKKGVIIIGKIYEDSAFETYIPIIVEHEVRSAFEGAQYELDNYSLNARKILDKWFPVFSQSLSEDAKINDSCSQQATSAPSSEAKSSVSHHVSMGAATESVANSEGRQQSMATCCRQQSEGSSPSPSSSLSHSFGTATGDGQRNNSPAATVSVALCSSVWEDDDMLVNCELPRGHEGEHRVNGDLGFHWKNDSEQTSTLTCMCGKCDLSRVPSVEEIKQLLSQPNGSISSEEYGCRQCGGAGELSSVSVGEVDVKHAARKGLGIKCGMGLHKSCQSKIRCGCECHKKEGEEK